MKMLDIIKKGQAAAFIPFLVVGDPSAQATERAVDILVEEGADLIELGVPFSDALADGPVIQAASERASKVFGSIHQVLEVASRIHQRHPKLAFILFTYFNPILKMGLTQFAQAARAAGAQGALVVDLPPEEAGEYLRVMAEHELGTVFLASPTTSAERVRLISQASTGFVYYVSRTGVTGVQQSLSTTLDSELQALRKSTTRPIAVGFGISTGPQARTVAQIADAVVVGSAFVRILAKYPNLADQPKMESEVRTLARELVGAIRSARTD